MVLAAGVAADGQDWRQVERLKVGTRVVVGAGGYDVGDRCRVVVVDASTLTCQEEGWRGVRLVYARAQVESVYRVRHPFPVWAGVALAILGVFIGGAISGNGTALGIGLIGGIVGLVIAGANNTARGWGVMLGQPPPPPSDEKLELVYYRGFVTGGPAGASMD